MTSTFKRSSGPTICSRFKRGLSALLELRYFVPFTPLGLAAAGLAAWAYFRVGSEQMDFVVYAASLVAGLVLVMAFGMVLLVTLFLWLRLRGQKAGHRVLKDLKLESGVRSVTGYSYPRLSILPVVQISMRWVDPAGVEVAMERSAGRVQEVVLPSQRGEQMMVRRRFIVADIFGLFRLGFVQRAPQHIRIDPGRARVAGRVITHFIGGDGISHPSGPPEGELLDMRRYAHGDPLRFVLWKVYARSRELLVRAPERAISPSPSAMAYFVAGPGDEPTAAAARFFIEEGMLGDDFLFAADGSGEPTSDGEVALEQVVRSVHARELGAAGLARFLDHGREKQRQSCLLFLPPEAGPWLERVERLAKRLSGVGALIAIDGELAKRKRGRVTRLLFRETPGVSGTTASTLPEVVSRLGRIGIDVRVLHRPSGEVILNSTILSEARA
jgi:hypothetical protein